MGNKQGREKFYTGACESCGHKKVCKRAGNGVRLCKDYVLPYVENRSQERPLEAVEAIRRMINGEAMRGTDTDEEDGLMLVWFAPRCSCFHWSYNQEFRGMYTNSFINLIPTTAAEACLGRTYKGGQR
jgi:hypothetical protein